jgi:hypothetical protein
VYISNDGNVNDLVKKLPDEECKNFQMTLLDQDMPVQWEAIVLRKKSRWLERINLNIAQRVPFLHDRHENLSYSCEEHFYPKATRKTPLVD